jgi:hypothetical protein
MLLSGAIAFAVVGGGLGLWGTALLSDGGPERPGGGAPAATAEEDGRGEEAAEDAVTGDAQGGESAEAAQEIAPTGVELRDGTISVTLTWTDNTGGDVPHYIVGGPVDAEEASMADVPAGETEVEITGLNPEVEYCFRVVAVESLDAAAPSERVCTDRTGEGD